MLNNFDLSGWFFRLILVFRRKSNIFFFNYLIYLLCIIKGVRLGKNIKFNGYPIINRVPNSHISIGDNCRMNSARKSTNIDLLRRCIFSTLSSGAEISIGNFTGASGVTIAAFNNIKIGNNVIIGAYCTIMDGDFHSTNPNKRDTDDFSSSPIVIEDNVFLGMNCIVLKGVTIGKNSTIGANSVVIGNMPPDSLAMGNPCKLVLKRNWSTPV